MKPYGYGLKHHKNLARRILVPVFSLMIVGLSACAPVGSNADMVHGWMPAGSPKALEVDKAQYRHIIYFDTDRDHIRADERDRFMTFMQTVNPTSNDSIRLEGHADERAADVYNIDLAARRIDAVKAFLVQSGLEKGRIHASAFGESLPASTGHQEKSWSRNRRVEVVLERYVVTTPPCPDWSRKSGLDYHNQGHSNFGCATETNLGLMIANPRDLVKGRKLGPADGVHQAEGIVRYRESELPELQEEGIE